MNIHGTHCAPTPSNRAMVQMLVRTDIGPRLLQGISISEEKNPDPDFSSANIFTQCEKQQWFNFWLHSNLCIQLQYDLASGLEMVCGLIQILPCLHETDSYFS